MFSQAVQKPGAPASLQFCRGHPTPQKPPKMLQITCLVLFQTQKITLLCDLRCIDYGRDSSQAVCDLPELPAPRRMADRKHVASGAQVIPLDIISQPSPAQTKDSTQAPLQPEQWSKGGRAIKCYSISAFLVVCAIIAIVAVVQVEKENPNKTTTTIAPVTSTPSSSNLFFTSPNILLAQSNQTFQFIISAGGNTTSPISFKLNNSNKLSIVLNPNGELTGKLFCPERNVAGGHDGLIYDSVVITVTQDDQSNAPLSQQLTLVCFAKNVHLLLQASDFHLNPNYSANANKSTKCLQPTVASPAEAADSDAGSTASSAAAYGQYGCDPPPSLLESAARAMAQIVATPMRSSVANVLFDGDFSMHSWGLEESQIISPNSVIAMVKEIFDNSFNNAAQVVSAIGNNDVYTDYNVTVGPNDQLMGLYAVFNQTPSWLCSLSVDTYMKGAYYSTPINIPNTGDAPPSCGFPVNPHGHRFLVLNSVYYSKNVNTNEPNFDISDPAGQFVWLEAELAKATAQGYKVLITGHISPGIDGFGGGYLWQEMYITKYLEIVSRYHSVIVTGVFSHQHKDYFNLFNKQENRTLILLNAAISPIYDNNPAFRAMFFDPITLEFVDYLTVYTPLADMQEPLKAAHGPVWSLLYAARSEYHMKGLSLDDFQNLAERLLQGYPNPTYETFANNYNARYDVSANPWTANNGHKSSPDRPPTLIRTQDLCGILNAYSNDYQRCQKEQDAIVAQYVLDVNNVTQPPNVQAAVA
eukprot:g46596.t1